MSKLLDGAVYDPATDSWQALPSVPVTKGHDVDQVVAAAVPGGIYAVLQWHHTTPTGDGSSTTGGVRRRDARPRPADVDAG